MLEKGERETLGPKVSNEHIEALSPDYWKAEYYEEKTHQTIACNFQE